MSLPVFTTPQAEAHIRAIDAWWREHGLAAPALFTEELASCFELMADAPHIGRPYRSSRAAGVRRLLLRATHYHVYPSPVKGRLRSRGLARETRDWTEADGVAPPARATY